jgi:hypothetical protein
MKKLVIVASAVLAGALLGAVISGSVQAAPTTPTTPQANPTPGAGNGFTGRGAMGSGMMGRGAMMGGQVGMETEALALLNMSREQLIAERQAGKSLAQIAQAKGVSRETLVNTILAAKKADLDKLVAAGTLAQAQADQMYQNMQQSVPQAVDSTAAGHMWQNGAGTMDPDDCPMIGNGQPNTQQNSNPRNNTRPGRGGMMRGPQA